MINLKNLIDFLPFEYKAQDTYKVNGKGILERFLEICGEHFEDYITKDIENILDIIDIDKALDNTKGGTLYFNQYSSKKHPEVFDISF